MLTGLSLAAVGQRHGNSHVCRHVSAHQSSGSCSVYVVTEWSEFWVDNSLVCVYIYTHTFMFVYVFKSIYTHIPHTP